MKIFIIAGEDSGDKLGSAIIDSLRVSLDTIPIFVGIGGIGMWLSEPLSEHRHTHQNDYK